MKERGMLFSTPMVLALLDGSKTQTRRIVKPQPDFLGAIGDPTAPFKTLDYGLHAHIPCPYGQPGDRIWVRETHVAYMLGIENGTRHYTRVQYRADGHKEEFDISSDLYQKLADAEVRGNWTPSIHMPRWASRITLEITGVRVQRLQDVSEADALAEGIESLTGDKTIYHWDFPKPRPKHAVSGYKTAVSAYKELWAHINGRESLDANPWVWVISFKVIKPQQPFDIPHFLRKGTD